MGILVLFNDRGYGILMAKKKTASTRKNKVKVLAPSTRKVSPGDIPDYERIDAPPVPSKVYLPGMIIEEADNEEGGDFELEPDMSAYVMLHGWETNWPCLSFDIIRDGGGEERTAFPMEACLVAGTQASVSSENQLILTKLSNLHKNQHINLEDSDEEESEEEEEDQVKQAKFSAVSIVHDGGVNRVRVHQTHPAYLTASWSERGVVNVWSMNEAFNLVEQGGIHTLPIKPIGVVNHRTEGYGLDWNRQSASLLAGNCNGEISLSHVNQDGVVETEATAFTASASIEDLQWSPSEATVFSSCSTDGIIRVWDTRLDRSKAALSCQASKVDLNVISWNRHMNHLLASGDDSGGFSTWDLRSLQAPVFSSNWHRNAIACIEWNPVDPTVLAVSGADDQLTLWDLSVEKSEEGAEGPELPEGVEVPPQLLFIHQGQKYLKELHWHPQLSGVAISTAGSGFNIFKTISV